jgi:hypothetical protein
MADAFEAARQAQQQAASTAQNSNEKPKSLDEYIQQLMEMPLKMISKVGGLGNVAGLFNTGIDKAFGGDLSKLGIQVNNQVNRAAANFTVNTMIASTISDGVQFSSIKDFSKVQVPEMTALNIGPPEHVDMSFLSNLRPDPTPYVDMGRGMDRMV